MSKNTGGLRWHWVSGTGRGGHATYVLHAGPGPGNFYGRLADRRRVSIFVFPDGTARLEVTEPDGWTIVHNVVCRSLRAAKQAAKTYLGDALTGAR
jgi:hypothetical protein